MSEYRMRCLEGDKVYYKRMDMVGEIVKVHDEQSPPTYDVRFTYTHVDHTATLRYVQASSIRLVEDIYL